MPGSGNSAGAPMAGAGGALPCEAVSGHNGYAGDRQAVQVSETLFGPGYFDRIQGQTEKFKPKPDPACALWLAKELGVSCGDCLYVGDTDTDMRTGNRAGMRTVGVTWGFRERKELEENGAEKIIQKPEELLLLAEELLH